MKIPLLSILLTLLLAGITQASTMQIYVAPEGDGNSHRARYGFFDTWNDYAFQPEANPNHAEHYYESGWGEIKNVFLQISLSSLSNPTLIENATLNIYVTNFSGNGSSLLHRADASTATGLASQQLAGNVMVMDLTPANIGSAGWLSIDVTDYILQDLDNAHAWAVFSLPSKSNSLLAFSSAENITGFAPYLNVQLVPEPSSLLLIISGAWLIRLRRA